MRYLVINPSQIIFQYRQTVTHLSQIESATEKLRVESLYDEFKKKEALLQQLKAIDAYISEDKMWLMSGLELLQKNRDVTEWQHFYFQEALPRMKQDVYSHIEKTGLVKRINYYIPFDLHSWNKSRS